MQGGAAWHGGQSGASVVSNALYVMSHHGAAIIQECIYFGTLSS